MTTTPAPNLSAPQVPSLDDASIPMLTERLTLPPLELDTTLPQDLIEEAPAEALAPTPAPVPAPAPPAPAAARASPAEPRAAPSRTAPEAAATGAHWTRIELELRASILHDLAQSLPQEVDAIVRGKMSEAIDRLVHQLAAETRLAIAASLREIVEHAVRAELDRLRGRKR